MSTRHERMNDKALNERNAKILKALMALPENRTCADCKRRDPRWASHNLGLFVCLRCSGIHRSLGVHISKMKSADLDSWTPDQVNNMIQWGNARANWWWEARATFEPNDSNIELYIRCKYERLQFVRSDPIPEPKSIPVGSWYDPATGSVTQGTTNGSGAKQSLPLNTAPAPASSPQPSGFAAFDDFAAAPPQAAPPANQAVTATPTPLNPNAAILDLFSTPIPPIASSAPSSSPSPVPVGFAAFPSFPPLGTSSTSTTRVTDTAPKSTSGIPSTSVIPVSPAFADFSSPSASQPTNPAPPKTKVIPTPSNIGLVDFGAFSSYPSQPQSTSNPPKTPASTTNVPPTPSALVDLTASVTTPSPNNFSMSNNVKSGAVPAGFDIFGDITSSTGSNGATSTVVSLGMGGQPAAAPSPMASKPDPFDALGVFGGL